MNTETLKAQNETLAQDSTKSKLSFKSESDLERYCVDWHREKEEYNGWSNYATWRINLEMIDAEVYENRALDGVPTPYNSIRELADDIKDDCEETIELDADGSLIVGTYALAFLDDVNWYEIAEHIAEDYPSIIKASDDGL